MGRVLQALLRGSLSFASGASTAFACQMSALCSTVDVFWLGTPSASGAALMEKRFARLEEHLKLLDLPRRCL